MPNYRTVTALHGEYSLTIRAKPVRWFRRWPVLRSYLPYLTGNHAQLEIEVKVYQKVHQGNKVIYSEPLGPVALRMPEFN